MPGNEYGGNNSTSPKCGKWSIFANQVTFYLSTKCMIHVHLMSTSMILYIYIPAHTHTYLHTHIHTCTNTHTCLHKHTHTYIPAHTHIPAHIHTQVCNEWYRVIADGLLWKKLIERKVATDTVWKGLSERRGW